MKKIFAFLSVVIFALACAAPPTNKDMALDTNKDTNLAAEKSPAVAMTEAEAITKEKAIWETIKNKDYEAFGAMLANDQVEVTGEGVSDKAGTVAAVKDFEPREITFSDWKFLAIDKHAVVLTYTVDVKGKLKGKEFPFAKARGTSAWVNRDGKWLAMYHQESPIMPPPPAAKTPAKAAASPAVSPAASAAIAIGSDPIANEKAIWDALKAKNFDGFASALAADAIEVEASGVYDKAGTVKNVSESDFAKAEVSDFKAVPIDGHVALVTYVVKGPQSASRHTTIWSQRDGKWLAVFHQSTPIPKGTPTVAAPAMK